MHSTDSEIELIKRYEKNPILTADRWPYPVNTVFNTAATLFQGETLLLTRVEDRAGFSHFTIARSCDGLTNWRIERKPALFAEPDRFPEEKWGIEDPRITFLAETDVYAITYTAYSECGPLVSLAITRDFQTFEKVGAILPPDNKDAALFPVKFGDRWTIIHRPSSSMAGAGGHMWLSFSPDLKHWGGHRVLMTSRRGGWWDSGKVGISPQPIEIPEGWLVLYHGVKQAVNGAIYRQGLVLLDRNNPAKVLRRSREWIMAPRDSYERIGDVDSVIFVCGWVVEDDDVRIYYGGADTCIAVATTKLSSLRNYILRCPESDE